MSSKAAQTSHATSHDPTISTDHKFIRHWIEERRGGPTRVRDTESKAGEGILRVDFAEPDDKLEPISWEEFLEAFEDGKLGFLHQDETSDARPAASSSSCDGIKNIIAADGLASVSPAIMKTSLPITAL